MIGCGGTSSKGSLKSKCNAVEGINDANGTCPLCNLAVSYVHVICCCSCIFTELQRRKYEMHGYED